MEDNIGCKAENQESKKIMFKTPRSKFSQSLKFFFPAL